MEQVEQSIASFGRMPLKAVRYTSSCRNYWRLRNMDVAKIVEKTLLSTEFLGRLEYWTALAGDALRAMRPWLSHVFAAHYREAGINTKTGRLLTAIMNPLCTTRYSPRKQSVCFGITFQPGLQIDRYGNPYKYGNAINSGALHERPLFTPGGGLLGEKARRTLKRKILHRALTPQRLATLRARTGKRQVQYEKLRSRGRKPGRYTDFMRGIWAGTKTRISEKLVRTGGITIIRPKPFFYLTDAEAEYLMTSIVHQVIKRAYQRTMTTSLQKAESI